MDLHHLIFVALVGLCLLSCDTSVSSGSPASSDGGDDVLSPASDDATVHSDASTDSVDPDDPQASLVPCATDADCSGSKPYCAPVGFCVACLDDSQCGEGTCEDGTCVTDGCAPGATLCQGTTLMICNQAGTTYLPIPCNQCEDGVCVACSPGKKACIGQKAVQCRPDGSGYDTLFLCAASQYCIEGGCYNCYPGTKQCSGEQAQVCSLEGTWSTFEDCSDFGFSCQGGECQSGCLLDQKSSNVGCEYWAVDLDNHFDAQSGQYAIIVSNLSDEAAALVTVTARDSADAEVDVVAQASVPPGGLEKLLLPARHMGDAGIGYNAYRVQSNAPIVAYQFNPLDNESVFSNDASLLLPTNALGTSYLAMSRFELAGSGPEVGLFESCAQVCGQVPGGYCQTEGLQEVCIVPYRGEVAVVASAENTQVTVRPTTRILGGGDVPPLNAGEEHTFLLAPYQVLNLKSDSPGGDLTGTSIVATKPIAVWSGHEAAVSGSVCCADHLEQQLFPTNTWGKNYVAARSAVRDLEPDYWRIVAQTDGTAVGFSPSSVSGTKVLNAGDFVEIASTEDFVIEATEPVMVAQILASSFEVLGDFDPQSSCGGSSDCPDSYTCQPDSASGVNRCIAPSCNSGSNTCPAGHACSCISQFFIEICQCQPIGDPALILTPPVEQFREDYVFLVPNAYTEDYITVVAPLDANVSLNGAPFTAAAWSPVGVSEFKAAKIAIPDGVHSLTSDLPVGVTVYGYDDDVSYGYTAGLNLLDL